MPDDFTEMKRLVIDNLAGQIDSHDKREMGKDYKLTEDQVDELIRKMLDKWLDNVDFVVMIASVLGISLPRKTKDRSSRYIG